MLIIQAFSEPVALAPLCTQRMDQARAVAALVSPRVCVQEVKVLARDQEQAQGCFPYELQPERNGFARELFFLKCQLRVFSLIRLNWV